MFLQLAFGKFFRKNKNLAWIIRTEITGNLIEFKSFLNKLMSNPNHIPITTNFTLIDCEQAFKGLS